MGAEIALMMALYSEPLGSRFLIKDTYSSMEKCLEAKYMYHRELKAESSVSICIEKTK